MASHFNPRTSLSVSYRTYPSLLQSRCFSGLEATLMYSSSPGILSQTTGSNHPAAQVSGSGAVGKDSLGDFGGLALSPCFSVAKCRKCVLVRVRPRNEPTNWQSMNCAYLSSHNTAFAPIGLLHAVAPELRHIEIAGNQLDGQLSALQCQLTITSQERSFLGCAFRDPISRRCAGRQELQRRISYTST